MAAVATDPKQLLKEFSNAPWQQRPQMDDFVQRALAAGNFSIKKAFELLTDNGHVRNQNEFKKKLWSIKNARKVAELGIGTNPKAILSGNVLEDEKVLGTCHVAVGDNTSYDGGKNKAEVHWDGIVIQPTIWFDDEKIMESGELLV